MTSSKLRSHKSTLSLRLPSFFSEKAPLEINPVAIAMPTGSESSPRSVTSSGSSEPDGGSTVAHPESQLPPGHSRRVTLDGGRFPERRKSILNFFSTVLQPLTSISPQTDTPHASSPEREYQVERKPLPHSAVVPDYLGMAEGLQNGHKPSYSLGTISPASLQPTAAAQDVPDAHRRKSSIPGLFFKALQKTPTEPIEPPLPHPALNHASTLAIAEPKEVSAVLKKAKDRSRSRSQSRSRSVDRMGTSGKLQPRRSSIRMMSPAPEVRVRSSSAQPPGSRDGAAGELRPPTRDGLRVVSTPVGAQHSRNTSDESDGSGRGRLRKSWFPGGRGRSPAGVPGQGQVSEAWVIAPGGGKTEYHINPLANGEKVPELWSENGNVLVYLFPKEAGRGPSFKVHDHIFASSPALTELMLAELISRANQPSAGPDASPAQPPVDGVTESHLYLPLGNTDLERLINARNLFAFLTGQPLIGTKGRATIFEALLQVSGLLRRFGFTNHDGSSYGDEVEKSFEICMDMFQFADVRNSPEKTLEALVLSEQMRSWSLYHEGFCHAVGEYESLLGLKSPLWGRLSSDTRTRLEKANIDLMNRRARVKDRLEAFEFPGLFAGIATSTSVEYKNIRFKEWRNNFAKMRAFVLSYYKDQFGSWPPKARSKRNQFSQSGLNRQCLKILYSDLCALYDLLVNREDFTTRVIDQDPEETKTDHVDPITILRKILGEFDHSQPPVLPPIPCDVPLLPSMTTIRENYNELPPKKQAKLDKSVQPNELSLILIKSHNIDTDSLNVPFLSAFKEFEMKEAKGMLPQDWVDQRVGYWLCLYAIIQSLPMLVVDAPDIRYTEGVEYFLCEPPMGNAPWMEDAGEVRKMWYQTAGQGIVELSADVVMFSVEATYMRSHCWLAAKEWAQGAGLAPPPPQEAELAAFDFGLPPPPAIFQDMDPMSSPQSTGPNSSPSSPQLRPRNLSPGRAFSRTSHYRASMAIGLEPIPIDGFNPSDRSSRVPSISGISGSGSSRPGSSAGMRPPVHARTISSGNTHPTAALAGGSTTPPTGSRVHSPQSADHGGEGPSTFDDILKGIEKDKEKKSKKRFGF